MQPSFSTCGVEERGQMPRRRRTPTRTTGPRPTSIVRPAPRRRPAPRPAEAAEGHDRCEQGGEQRRRERRTCWTMCAERWRSAAASEERRRRKGNREERRRRVATMRRHDASRMATDRGTRSCPRTRIKRRFVAPRMSREPAEERGPPCRRALPSLVGAQTVDMPRAQSDHGRDDETGDDGGQVHATSAAEEWRLSPARLASARGEPARPARTGWSRTDERTACGWSSPRAPGRSSGLSSDVRRQVERREHEDPHHVDEVPVEREHRHRQVVLGVEAAERAP